MIRCSSRLFFLPPKAGSASVSMLENRVSIRYPVCFYDGFVNENLFIVRISLLSYFPKSQIFNKNIYYLND